MNGDASKGSSQAEVVKKSSPYPLPSSSYTGLKASGRAGRASRQVVSQKIPLNNYFLKETF